MECFICKRDITSAKKASSVPMGGDLELVAHDRCLNALEQTVREEDYKAAVYNRAMEIHREQAMLNGAHIARKAYQEIMGEE